MKASVSTESQEVNPSFAETLSKFFQGNRKFLSIIGIALLAGIVLIGVVEAVQNSRTKAAISSLEILEVLYQDFEGLTTESPAEAAKPVVEKANELLASYSKVYAGWRARFILGLVHASLKEYDVAEKWFADIAEVSPRSNLAASALVNAASMAEERGDMQAALGYLQKTDAYATTYVGYTRALFTRGRILEHLEKPQEALAAYQQLVDRGESDDWSHLAKSRLILLKTAQAK